MKLKEGDIVRITYRRKPESFLKNKEFNSCLEGLFWIKSIWTDGNCDLFPVGKTTRNKLFMFEEKYLELAEEQELCQSLNSVGLL
jgi:hypothetical protein